MKQSLPKNFCRQSISALACLILLSSGVHAKDNILANGDLKEAKEGVPVGWLSGPATEKETPPDADYAYGKDPADPKRREVVSILYKAGDARAMWKTIVPRAEIEKKIKPGKKYEFSLWVRYELAQPPAKGKSPVSARCGVSGSDWESIVMPVVTPTGSYDIAARANAANLPSGAPAAPIAPYVQKDIPQKSDWMELKVVFQVPKETPGLPLPANCIVYVALEAPGQLWADDFKLVEVSDATPVTVQ